jgi:hypothetical protein
VCFDIIFFYVLLVEMFSYLYKISRLPLLILRSTIIVVR